MAADLSSPSVREEQYGDNLAQYLVDLHDSKSVFDFCGGMMFQLVLSERLRSHLEGVAKNGAGEQPVLFDAGANRMARTPGYAQVADADNAKIFHGREVRQVPTAEGGMGFCLQLTMADESNPDPEGWTREEISEYNGWAHDSQRRWRKGQLLESEGYQTFREAFGPAAFTLHHRFYLHRDGESRLWLSAEDGCEGTPAQPRGSFFDRLRGR